MNGSHYEKGCAYWGWSCLKAPCVWSSYTLPKSKCNLSDDLDEIIYSLPNIKVSKPRIFLADFNAHVGDDAGVWKGVTGQSVDEGKLVLKTCCKQFALCIMSTLHKKTWCRDSLGQWLFFFKSNLICMWSITKIALFLPNRLSLKPLKNIFKSLGCKQLSSSYMISCTIEERRPERQARVSPFVSHVVFALNIHKHMLRFAALKKITIKYSCLLSGTLLQIASAESFLKHSWEMQLCFCWRNFTFITINACRKTMSR